MNETVIHNEREVAQKAVKVNKRGFTMIELIGAMVIIAILTVAGITAIATAISNSRMSATQTDLSGFQSPIEQFMLENPQMAKENDTKKIAAALNEYLEGEMQFKDVTALDGGVSNYAASMDGASGVVTTRITEPSPSTIGKWQTKRTDAWDQPFRIYINPMNHAGTTGPNNNQDTELRIFVVSNGKNTTTGANNNNLDGDDDMFLMVQMVNGQVSHGMYGMRDGDSLFAAASTTAAQVKANTLLASSTAAEGVYKENGFLDKGSIQDLNNVILANTANK